MRTTAPVYCPRDSGSTLYRNLERFFCILLFFVSFAPGHGCKIRIWPMPCDFGFGIRIANSLTGVAAANCGWQSLLSARRCEQSIFETRIPRPGKDAPTAGAHRVQVLNNTQEAGDRPFSKSRSFRERLLQLKQLVLPGRHGTASNGSGEGFSCQSGPLSVSSVLPCEPAVGADYSAVAGFSGAAEIRT
jgi:hypothetical protein